MIPWRADWPRYVALGIGVLIATFGAAVLISWQFHFVSLIRPWPTLPPLTRQGGLSQLLCGTSLTFLALGRRKLAVVFATMAVVLAVVVAFEYSLGWDLGIDGLMGTDYVNDGSRPVGRMSPVATFSYLGTSLALLALSSRRLARYSPSFAGLVASMLIAFGSVTFLSYSLGHKMIYAWGHFRNISLQAASVLVLLGLGIMALAWRESLNKLPRWFPVGIGLGLTVGALGVWQALVAYKEGQMPMLSHIILIGGIAGAALIAVSVHLAQKATLRNRELQEEKAAYERLFEASSDALLVVDAGGKIVGANQRVQGLFGYASKELFGRPVEGLVPIDLRELHRSNRESYFALPRMRPMGAGLELSGRRKDGSEFPVEVALSPLLWRGETQVLAAVRDITERKQAQEDLRESEERFRSVFETSPLGLALIDQNQKLIQVNPSLCRLSGYSAEELIGMNPLESTDPDDLSKSRELAESLFKGEIPYYQLEKRYIKKNGETMWVTLTATILRDREGRPLVGLGMIEDITERKQAQEALRQSEEQFRGVFEQGPLGVTLIGKDYRLIKVNQAFCRMMGFSEAELTRMTPLDFTHPDDRPGTQERVQRLFEFGTPVQNVEKRYVTKSGALIWGSLNTSSIHDREGRLMYGMGMIEDITERKRTEDELRTLSQRLAQAIRFGSMSVWEWDPRKRTFVWDDAAFATAGIPKELPLPYERWASSIHPDDRFNAEAALHRVVREKKQESVEYRVVRPDGVVRFAYAAGGPVLDQEGKVVRVVGIAVDITGRKRAEEEMRVLSERLKLATRSASMGVWEWNRSSDLSIWDDAMFEIFGMTKRARVTREEWVHGILPDDRAKAEMFLENAVRKKMQQDLELRIVRPDHGVRYVHSAAGPVLDKQGEVLGVVGITEDITERKQTEEKLRTLSERLSLATRIAAMGVFDWDLRTNLEVWDDACFEMFGIARTSTLRHESFIAHIHPDDQQIVGSATERVIQQKTSESVEFRIIRPDRAVRYLSVAAGPVVDEEGKVNRIVGVAIDITARRQLQEDLDAAREQAITSARLSALGMMAGGIAHEINNPLSIIHSMASDLAEMVADEGSAAPQVVARKSGIIRETAERIAKIVRSLRQISREGAADPPHPTRVAKILEETLEICRAKFNAHGVALLLPKKIPDLSVPCREVQIAQALLNLLQNAFDAVVDQQGERWVRIELRQHEDSVSISVIDNGPGIPPELRARIMEPFFTTKEVGKGTGLGLSLSKTIAEEHGGRLEYGEQDGRTRFSLILPLARKAEAA